MKLSGFFHHQQSQQQEEKQTRPLPTAPLDPKHRSIMRRLGADGVLAIVTRLIVEQALSQVAILETENAIIVEGISETMDEGGFDHLLHSYILSENDLRSLLIQPASNLSFRPLIKSSQARMRLFARVGETEYQDVLSAVGLFLDEHGYTNIRVLETEEGLIVQGTPVSAGTSREAEEVATQTFRFPPEDIFLLQQRAETQRRISQAKRNATGRQE